MRRNACGPLALVAAALLCLALVGCGSSGDGTAGSGTTGGIGTAAENSSVAAPAQSSYTTLVEDFSNKDLGCGWEPVRRLDLQYARRLTIDEYADGYYLACLADGNRYLVVPEGGKVPEGLQDDITVIRQPVGDVYLAASDSLCLFQALDALDRITVSGIERDDWQIEAARDAMDAGRIVYGGKYRSPDYELLLDRGVRLAVESTMINHVPEVREKLEELGIPVLVELSSYEDEPLGRAEWIRLYGVLCGRDNLARERFQEQVDQVAGIQKPATGKSVAYFYLNANGAAVVRRPGDYVTRMIEQAGGTYAFNDLETAAPGSSSVTLEMERFYATAKDADVIIYNASIDDGVDSLDELVAKNALLADCKAVQTGEVWVTDKSMYQQMLDAGTMMTNINRVLCGKTEGLTYLRRLT